MPRIKYKCCSGCKETLPQTNFYSHRGTCDGLKYLCKPCTKEQEKKRVMRLVQLRKERKIDVNDQKVCKHCDRLKPMSEFPRRNSNCDGRAGHCKDCKAKEYQKRKNKQSRYTQDNNPLVWLLSAAMEDSHVEVYI